MKKSPLSTPSGSRQKQNYNWKVHDQKNRTGYNHVKSDSNYQCTSPNEGQIHSGNDFIPLNYNTSTPERNKFNSNCRGSRGRNYRNSGSGGFNHFRNNYHSTPKSHFNNSHSPYKHSGKQLYGYKKGYQRDAHKHVDISSYIDMKSFLEDPWAELTKKLNDSKEVNGEIAPKIEQLFPSESVYVDAEPSSESKSLIDVDVSRVNSESKNEFPMDVALGLDGIDVNSVSKTESSVDIKFENARFSQESHNKSNCSNNDSVYQDLKEENNICYSSGPTISVIQDVI